MNSGFVVLMGLGTVFFGLICIILVCMLMSFLVRIFQKTPEKNEASAQANSAEPVKSDAIPSRPELAAAMAAAIAEYSGKDISGIRIHSIKKL